MACKTKKKGAPRTGTSRLRRGGIVKRITKLADVFNKKSVSKKVSKKLGG